MTDIAWYWCLTHQRAEAAGDRDDPDNALGPYESPDAARDWKERSEARAQAWKEQDEAWEDDEPEPGA
jgi:hypothetical protein